MAGLASPVSFSGDIRRYALPPAPSRAGGQAEVFRAVRKSDGAVVALKRLRNKTATNKKRMRREIDVQSHIDNPHVMPILDADPDSTWLVMPWADGSLAEVHTPVSVPELADALHQAAVGLDSAHASGHVHRDVTPGNILYFLEQSGVRRWVVADWGLVRRPRGKTTNLLTKGVTIGTQGYIAPEVFASDAHEVTAAADVYSLGCVAAWALTGTPPAPGAPTLPVGRWRSFLRRATDVDPRRRIPDMASFRTLLSAVSRPVMQTPVQQQRDLLDLVTEGNLEAAGRLTDLALQRPEDAALHLDVISRMRSDPLKQLVRIRPSDVVQVLHQMVDLQQYSWDYRPYRQLDQLLLWMLTVARAAADGGDLDTLEDVAVHLLDCCAWDQFPLYEPVRNWLRSLDEPSQHAAAAALQQTPAGRDWLRDTLELEVDDRPVLYDALHGD